MPPSPTLSPASAFERQRALAVAQDHMTHLRWAQAADVLLALPGREVPEEFQLNVCRNLASLQRCRPAVYQAIVGAREAERYIVGIAACGHITIYYRADDGSQVPLSPGNQPVAGLSSLFAKIKKEYQAGQPAAIYGMGDGYLLKSFALNPPKLLFGAQQSVYLLEPDAQAVLAGLTIHDYTGPAGPIEDPRFRWFVGSDYQTAMRECLLGDLFNPAPMFEVGQSPHRAIIAKALRQVLDETFANYQRMKAAVDAYYEALTRDDLASIFSPSPPRKPRILLITTLSSTVLQYSTRDAAEGLNAIGWDARVFIEPTLHHTVTGPKLMELLHDFKPDAVFQIDHVRSEWQDTYPPQLPFICWIQDHLPNLTSVAAGAAITLRDYLLCGMPRMYSDRFAYPARQFLQMPKLTRIPTDRAATAAAGDDLVYVSSASQLPEERARQLIDDEGANAPICELLALCCGKMIDHYAAGHTLHTQGAILPIVQSAEAETGFKLPSDESRQRVVEKLFDRLNNVLYRQQALRWAQSAAAEQGLSLAIYGAGWDKHPEFARFARGPIAYGPALEAMTRASRINLVLEPTLNISHQRLLDALVAGGFCLIRHHPANALFQDFLNFLCERAPQSAQTVPLVRAALPAEHLPEFERLLKAFDEFTVLGDPVAHVRGLFDSKILLHRPSALPDLADVSFRDEAELKARVRSFLADPGRRRAVAERQRVDVERRFSYACGMRRMVDWIAGLLSEEVS